MCQLKILIQKHARVTFVNNKLRWQNKHEQQSGKKLSLSFLSVSSVLHLSQISFVVAQRVS